MSSDILLQELQNRNLLTPDAVTRLKRDALLANKSVEAILFEQRLIDDALLAKVKSEMLRVPYRKVDLASIDDSLIGIIPEDTARTYGVAPLSRQGDMLVAGMVHPDDNKAQEALKFIAHQNRANLGVFLISYGDWEQILRKYSPYRNEIQEAVQSMNLKQGMGGKRVVELEGTQAHSEDAPVIRIVGDTIKEAVQSGASDIHFEPQENYLRVRFRVDGDLHEVANLPKELTQLVVSRVKILSNLKIDETRVPQDGRFGSKVFDREIDFRVATFPTPLGEKVAIRVLDPTTGLKSFEALGLTGINLKIVQQGLEKPYGMVLVTGPTGSGKTTTLYAMLQRLNSDDVNIVSLEDPVEYFVPGINQSQVRPEIGYDFASGLRQILRQDPDIIMVGEIRDTETAGLAINAALTGHIVLSTLHTNNAAGVIPRLVDMKVEPFLLPSALNLMIAQRLVSVICQNCKKAEAPSAPMQEIIEEALAGLPAGVAGSWKKPFQIYHSPGCDKCKGKGVTGRMAIFEVIRMTPGIEAIVNADASLQKILAEQKKQGAMTMRQDGILKALAGLITLEEVIKETEEV